MEKVGFWTVGCLLLLAIMIALVVIGTFVLTLVWSWVVPDVFAGAVEQGILPSALTFWQAFKLMVLFAVLGITHYSGAANK